MITSNIQNSKRYLFNNDFIVAFNYLSNEDLNAIPYGKHQITDHIFVIKETYYTMQLGETFWEGHEQFIDIQFILEGEEQIAYSPIHYLSEIMYHQEKDLKIFKGEVNSYIQLKKNEFAIFFPEDAHMPGLNSQNSSSQVHKIIIKIKVR